jgi:hypothetical protein
MSWKESYNFITEMTVHDIVQNTKSLNEFGVKTMPFDSEIDMLLTPQQLKFLSYAIVENHPEFYSSYRSYANFFVGKGVYSDNKEVTEYLEKNRYLQKEVKKAAWNYLITGDAYVQLIYNQTKTIKDNENYNKPEAVQTIDDSSRVFYNLDAKNNDDFWLYSLAYTQNYGFTGFRNAKTKSKYQFKPGFYWIKYSLNQMFQGIFEYCIPIPKSEILHLKNEYSRNAYYGYSSLMASWSYARALKSLIDNIYTIGKHRAVGKKIIFPKNPGERVPVNMQKQLEYGLNSQNKDHIISNTPLEIQSLSNEGEFNVMSEPMDYIRKAIMSGSIPTFLTAFASDFNNRSLSDDSLLGFFLDLESDRENFLDFWNETLSVLIYGDKVHDCGLYLNAPKAKMDKGGLNISNESNDDGDNQPMEFLRERHLKLYFPDMSQKTKREGLREKVDNKRMGSIIERVKMYEMKNTAYESDREEEKIKKEKLSQRQIFNKILS